MAVADSKLAEVFAALPVDSSVRAMDLHVVQGNRLAFRCNWLKVSHMGVELSSSHMQEDHVSVPDGLAIFKKLLL